MCSRMLYRRETKSSIFILSVLLTLCQVIGLPFGVPELVTATDLLPDGSKRMLDISDASTIVSRP